MKLSLKNTNFKDIIINHAEKIVFGCIALLAVVVLWNGITLTGYDKQPADFQRAVEKGSKVLASNNWDKELKNDPEKAEKYLNQQDIEKDVREIIPPDDHKNDSIIARIASQEPGIPIDPPLKQEIEPDDQPYVSLLEDPIAKSGVVVIAQRDDGEEVVGEGEGDSQKQDNNKETVGEFDVKKGATGRGGAEGDGQFIEGPMVDEGGEPMGMGDENELLPAINRGKGERFVSVRMIFPLRKQYEAFAKALHKSVPEVMNEVVITDFKLQRMEAVAGLNPWAGNWEDVNIEDAFEVLDKSADFDEDDFSFEVTDIITVPLPMRLMGSWKKWASHPRIDNFPKSKEGLALEKRLKAWMAINEIYIKEQNKNTIQIKKGGFGSRQRNFRGLSSQIMGGEGRETVVSRMERDMRGRGQRRGIDRQSLEEGLTAAGTLLLFRYLDFEVKPGKIYRYRARVQLKNPNFNKPVEALRIAATRNELYLDGGWSKSTTPVLVPLDVKYYIAKVSTPIKEGAPPSARIDVFHWRPESGTVANSLLEVKIGEFIKRNTNTYILKPGAGTFEKEDVEIGPTEDVLVDINNENFVRPVITKTMFKDLLLSKDQIGIGTTDQILVVDQYGRLISKNPMGDSADLKVQKARIARMHAASEDIKDARKKAEEASKETTEGDVDLSEFSGMQEEESGRGSKRRSRRNRRRNPSRIQSP